MKRVLSYAVAIMALVIGLAAPIALAQTTAAGPYYATPSWDQQLPASTRFAVLSNWVDTNFPSGGAAVLDRETGLLWERSPDPGQETWLEAQNHCRASSVGGRKGWRVPTIEELASLVAPNAGSAPFLPAGHPFMNVNTGDLPSAYWSATSNASNASLGFIVTFGSSSAIATTPKLSTYYAWCVRGGRGLDPQ